jgi:transposase-like protein
MDAHTRLGWVRLYERVGNAGLVCRRCGISRPTLRKWWHRYQAEGEVGLEARSHRPHTSSNRKVLAEQEALILRLRRERKLALDIIHEVLVRHGENQLK